MSENAFHSAKIKLFGHKINAFRWLVPILFFLSCLLLALDLGLLPGILARGITLNQKQILAATKLKLD